MLESLKNFLPPPFIPLSSRSLFQVCELETRPHPKQSLQQRLHSLHPEPKPKLCLIKPSNSKILQSAVPNRVFNKNHSLFIFYIEDKFVLFYIRIIDIYKNIHRKVYILPYFI